VHWWLDSYSLGLPWKMDEYGGSAVLDIAIAERTCEVELKTCFLLGRGMPH
jgi:hypothetical protein